METESPRESKTGLIRIWRALFYSIDGLKLAWSGEAAFRQEVALAMVLVPICLVLPATFTQQALMFGSVMLLLIVELLNSAVEAAIDRISLDSHELSKRAKDIGSASVLLALVNLMVIWALVIVDIL